MCEPFILILVGVVFLFVVAWLFAHISDLNCQLKYRRRLFGNKSVSQFLNGGGDHDDDLISLAQGAVKGNLTDNEKEDFLRRISYLRPILSSIEIRLEKDDV